MSIKYFCDNCNKEIFKEDMMKYRIELHGIMVRIIHGFKNTWNNGHICHDCIRKTVATGKLIKEE